MKHLEISAVTGGGGLGIEMSEIAALEDKWEGQLNKVPDIIDGIDVFTGGRCIRSLMEHVGFLERKIPVGQFQWFLYIVSYLQLFTGETVSTTESQQDEVHVAKVRKTKEKSIVISSLKTDVPPILGGLGEGKESTTLLTYICTPKIRNANDGVRGLYPRTSKSLQDQILKINASINRELKLHM